MPLFYDHMTAVNLGLAEIMSSKTVGVGILCLLASTLSAPAKEIKLYGVKGTSIMLPLEQLPQGTKVKSIVWEHGQHIAAAWEEGDEAPTYYGIFNSTSTTLDMKTWALTISNLQPHFGGKYSAEVNNKNPAQSLNLVVINAVPVYGVKGQSITLEPEVPNVHVESVEWAHNSTIIALWDGWESESLYQTLLLDSETFALTITDLRENASGLYTFTVDNVDTGVSYLLIVRDAMLELRITKECNSTTCTLHCTGMDNEITQVSWTDNKGGKKTGPVWRVEKSPHLDVIYTCTSDSGSWKTKSISERELFPDPFIGNTGPNLGKILGPVAVAVAVAVLVLIAVGVVYRYMTRRGQPQNNEHKAGPLEEDDGNPLHGRMEGDREEEDEV